MVVQSIRGLLQMEVGDGIHGVADCERRGCVVGERHAIEEAANILAEISSSGDHTDGG